MISRLELTCLNMTAELLSGTVVGADLGPVQVQRSGLHKFKILDRGSLKFLSDNFTSSSPHHKTSTTHKATPSMTDHHGQGDGRVLYKTDDGLSQVGRKRCTSQAWSIVRLRKDAPFSSRSEAVI